MKILDRAQTVAALPYSGLVDAIELMAKKQSEGTARAPVRTGLSLDPGSDLLIMPAVDDRYAGIKIVTVHPTNSESGRSVVQSDMLLLDARTGERLMLLHGDSLTSRRTAALSVVGARKAGRFGGRSMLLYGSGVQAGAQARAFIECWGITDLYICSRNRRTAEALCCDLLAEGTRTQIVTDDVSAASDVDIIVCATTSVSPVVPSSVPDTALIVAMGAYRPDMAEVSAEVVRRSVVIVDTLDGARIEAGDLLQAHIDWDRVIAFCDNGGRMGPGPILVKTVGHALWDLAAAELAFDLSTR